jgi:excisionase family DNA binding protein
VVAVQPAGVAEPRDSPVVEKWNMRLLTKREAAAFLRVSERILDRFRAEKLITAIKVRGVIRFREEDLLAFLRRFSRN